MSPCPTCSAQIPDGASFCPVCGSPSDAFATRSASIESATHGAVRQWRLGPGQLIAQRFRITGLLGRGGMGEVFRAEDLRLGQAVALKFLPEHLRSDPEALERLRAEVRAARQVTHPNVCRVHDLVEHAGQHFLTMEFIDGEDLGSLLRRIGRLPEGKAIQVARELCAGLMAAHDHGVIHRDLKPANVMIDGRGHARITDFGLATLASSAADEVVGTPSHMAPELLRGRAASHASDIYALGLVLYELFTGVFPFTARTLAEWQQAHQQTPPRSPLEHVPSLDPAIERLILACLEKEPAQRPPSSRFVLAGLPGSDALAIALAAGETPSPEVVAAASVRGGLTIRQVSVMVVVLVALAVLVASSAGIDLFLRVPFALTPEVLADRAAAIAVRVGATADAPFRAFGLHHDESYLDRLDPEADPLPAPERWHRLASGQPPVISFWYRQSSAPIASEQADQLRVDFADSPAPIAGSASLRLDLRARLLEFRLVPAVGEAPREQPTDWSACFQAAGLSPASFRPVSPTWLPPMFASERAAWIGTFADHPDLPLRIEAAAVGGRPVWFRLIAPFERDPSLLPQDPPARTLMAVFLIGGVVIACLVFATFLAWRNARQERVDRRGALRLAMAVFVIRMLAFITGYRGPSAPPGVFIAWLIQLQVALLMATICWLAYLALEPTMRRRGPTQLVSWTRVLAGQWRDPLVGRDVLTGGLFGMAIAAAGRLAGWCKHWTGNPYPPNHYQRVEALEGAPQAISVLLDFALRGLTFLFVTALLMGLLRALVRSGWLAGLLTWAVLVAPPVLVTMHSWPAAAAAAATTGLTILVLMRHGLLAAACANVFADVANQLPLCVDFGTGYANSTMAAWIVLGALTAGAAAIAAGRTASAPPGFAVRS